MKINSSIRFVGETFEPGSEEAFMAKAKEHRCDVDRLVGLGVLEVTDDEYTALFANWAKADEPPAAPPVEDSPADAPVDEPPFVPDSPKAAAKKTSAKRAPRKTASKKK